MGNRIIIVANRLPVTVNVDEKGISYKQSPGGLVTALGSLKGSHEQVWIGWPGQLDLSAVDPNKIREDLKKEFNAYPVFLNRKELKNYYYGFSNRVLWPALHYLPTHIEYEERFYQSYKQVNQRFADHVIELLQNGNRDDVVWVQDYQLMLVPGMVREAIPDAKIGFFLHTPFPSSELFRALPHREELLQGLLGASLVGFHTYSYQRHFRSSVLHILGIDSEMDIIELETHLVKVGVFPISIDPDKIDNIIESTEINKDLEIVRHITRGRRMILSVDRLDYTKGIPERLKAYKKFLQRNPELVKDFVLIQIAVPSRTEIPDYRHLKDQVEILVQDILDTFETEEEPPLHYMYKQVPFSRLCAFYKEAEVALVTPHFDGMNLVAKEYVASQKNSGVLILSELAGAASELGEALIINPWNPEQISFALEEAIEMPQGERRRRMSAMYEKVKRNNVFYWSHSFLNEIMDFYDQDTTQEAGTIYINYRVKDDIIDRIRNAKTPLIISDYDGTLTQLVKVPFSARPDGDLRELLEEYTRGRIDMGIVSARQKSDVEDWLGSFNLILSADHGLWIRWKDERSWHKMVEEYNMSWYTTVQDIFNQFNLKTPGAFTEEKEASIAWHYRLSDPTFGKWQARELTMHLNEILANQPVEVINGKSVVEIRVQGIHKGNLIHRIDQLDHSYDFIMAIGDDATDEHLYTSLPEDSIGVKVGSGVTHARYRIKNVADVRLLLKDISREVNN